MKTLSPRTLAATVSVLALVCIMPAAASAAEWYDNGHKVEKVTETKFKGTITIYDTPAGFEREEMRCQDTGTGTVAPKGSGEITKWTMTGCENLARCQTPHFLEARPLPWTMGLTLSEGKYLYSVTKAATTPEFRLACQQFTYDECPVPSATLTVGPGNDVTATIEKRDKCFWTQGENAGVTSKQTIELSSGHQLRYE